MQLKFFTNIILVISVLASIPSLAIEINAPSSKRVPLYASFGVGAVVVSNPVGSFEKTYHKNEVEFTFQDGTRIGGFFFEKQNPNPVPLIIINFGALADRWFNTSRRFIREIILSGKLNAHVLILDSVSSAGFYALNHNLSLGGNDEGRLMVELAAQLQDKPLAKTSSLHMMGVSLGGLATVHTLLEDARLNTHYFKSAITFSGVLNEETSTEKVLATFGHVLEGSAGKTLSLAGKGLLFSGVPHFNSLLKARGVADFKLDFGHVGDGLYTAFQERLNAKYQRMSVESYVQWSSNLIEHIDSVKVPLYVVHSEDDMIIPYSDFESFAQKEKSNPSIRTLGVKDGGHWGYEAAYGSDWVLTLVNQMLEAK